ncbi:hypothetical protein D3C80_1281510 [compost metagenome]
MATVGIHANRKIKQLDEDRIAHAPARHPEREPAASCGSKDNAFAPLDARSRGSLAPASQKLAVAGILRAARQPKTPDSPGTPSRHA